MSPIATSTTRLPRKRRHASLQSPRGPTARGDRPVASVEVDPDAEPEPDTPQPPMANGRGVPPVTRISDEVENQRDRAVDRNHSHDERVVSFKRTLYQFPSRTRQAEHRFDD